jgi:hypothetical protein
MWELYVLFNLDNTVFDESGPSIGWFIGLEFSRHNLESYQT